MSRAQSVPPPSVTDDRTTERRLIPSVPYPSMPAESAREQSQEDFLFHLYRGSELLQENRILEAKEELEYALTVQPTDAKGQDLLGAVYFRLGLYPRAIQIYDALERAFPNDASIKVNLALCHLKTGQPADAKRALQDAVRINPEHKRAWGYLGLALQKLGELESSQIAFERGGHAMMAKRVTERRQRNSIPVPPEPPPPEIDEGVRSVAETAFSELDAGELRFSLADPSPPKPHDGPWHTLEPGDATKAAGIRPRTVPPASLRQGAGSVHEHVTVPPASGVPKIAAPALTAAPPAAPVPAQAIAHDALPSLLALGVEQSVARLQSGVVLARTTEEHPFASRLDSLRVVAGPITTRVLHRRSRDAETSEVLGGIGSPIVRLTGSAELVLGARASHELATVALDDEIAFLREDTLLGFELRLSYENGRLAVDPAGESTPRNEGVHLVQLRGKGALVLEVAASLARVPCTSGRSLLVRREWIVGWLGRLVPRALPPAESPSGQRGLIAFSGDGTVLVSIS
ncbi:MAG TPA: tetratricopeptide repeat protein [Polyangiaceae bacterium]